MWSGSRSDTKDKRGVHGVGLAIKKELWDSVEEKERTLECSSARG